MAVVLIGMVAVFALPKLNWGTYRINGSARSVTALLSRAERMAVTDQYNVNVLFDVANNAIKIHEDANNDNVIQTTERVRSYPLGEGIIYGSGGAPARVYSPIPISFTHTQGGLKEVIFRRDGSASENGGFYITTTNSQKSSRPQDARSIEVIRATGRPDWFKYTGTIWQQMF